MKTTVLTTSLLFLLLVACGDSAPKDLELTQDVSLDKFGISLKLPADWTVEEETDYNDEFSGYLIAGKDDVMRIEKRERTCFEGEADLKTFAQLMTDQHKAIDSKTIPDGKGRTPDKLAPVKNLAYPNGAYGVQYRNEFTTEVDGVEEFIERTGLYTFDFKTKAGVCLSIENTTYNNEGETLPTDLKIIQSIQ